MAYNYIVTAQKPTAVTHALLCSFTGPGEQNLVIAKKNRLEIHTLTPDGLIPELDAPIYGSIASLQSYRPHNSDRDYLFILTQRYKFCILGYNADTRRVVTVANGDMRDKVGKPVESGGFAIVDPQSRVIGMFLYEGTLKILPTESTTFRDAYNVRLAETTIIDIAWLHGTARPTLCILHEDRKQARHVITYVLDMQEKELLPGPWSQSNVEHQAEILIPVPSPLNGVIIVGAQTISYHACKLGISSKSIAMHTTAMNTYGIVNDDGTRFLLSDNFGALHVLALQHDGTDVTGLAMDTLGETSIAQTLVYLDNGVVFVGSSFGDAQLIKLLPAPGNDGSHVEVIEEYLNVGPILDMCAVDVDRQGQCQAVTCSGAYKDGSLRVVRSGIGINEQASIELPGIKGIWSLRPSSSAEYDKYLVQSFIGETRVLAIQDDELGEMEIPGFSAGETLFTGNAVGDLIIQITAQSVRLVSCDTLACVAEWCPPAPIIVATANTEQIAVALSGGQIFTLEFADGQLIPRSSVELEHDVACLSIRPVATASDSGSAPMSLEHDPASAAIPSGRSNILAVCMWTDMTVRLYALPDLHEVCCEPLGVDTQARDVMIITLESTHYVIVGMGDGAIVLFSMVISEETGLPVLTSRKKVILGTHPIALNCFQSSKHLCVFASCDRPTVIYSAGGKLVYANVDVAEVSHMASFHSETFPECLAMVSEIALSIGVVDEIQKLHIRKIPLKESPRRIAYAPSTHTFAVCLSAVVLVEDGPESKDRVAFFDNPSFEEVDSFTLDPFEHAQSCTMCEFEGKPDTQFFVVGTAYLIPGEDEPSKGRVLVFAMNANKKAHLVTEKEVRGAVYCLTGFNGKLLAGIGSKVQLFRFADKPDGVPELQTECGHHGHVLVLYLRTQGDFIIVGDFMRSIVVLQYKEAGGTIEEVARDFNAHYMRGIEVLDESLYLGADDFSNLFVVRANPNAATEEDRAKLELQAEYHLGDDANVFRKGALNVQPRDQDEQDMFSNNTVLYGCVSGAIGCIIPLSEELFRFFHSLEKGMRTVVHGVGGFSHEEWRSFHTVQRATYTFNQSHGTNKNVVDGDLVETLMDLSQEQMEQVVKFVNDDLIAAGFITEPIHFDEAVKRVEEMTRTH